MDLKKNAYDKQFEAKSFSFFLHDKLQKSDLDNFFGFINYVYNYRLTNLLGKHGTIL